LAGDTKAAAEKFAKLADDALAPQIIQCEAGYAAGRLYVKLNDKKQAQKFLQDAIGAGVMATVRTNPAMGFWQRQAQALLLSLNPQSVAMTDKTAKPAK